MSRSSREATGQRHVALLRAINVGGRRVSMEALRQAFAGPGVGDVDTFLASGNVLFQTARADVGALERTVERRLVKNLGFPVDVFVRSAQEIAAVVGGPAFDAGAVDAAQAFNVGFLRAPLTASARKTLDAMTTEIDRFDVVGREVYWLCQVRQSDSGFSNVAMEEALGVRATFRAMSTLARLQKSLSGER